MKNVSENKTNRPKAVLISDIHFNVNALDVASKVLIAAMEHSKRLKIPLIIAGDLLDTKAIIRAEVANRLIEILKSDVMLDIYILVGNHDLINEKGKEHALNFLDTYAFIVRSPIHLPSGVYALPYFSNNEELKAVLSGIPKGSTIVCHQGVLGAEMGHYIQDTSSLPPEVFANYRVVSGHYHKRQDIKCGPPSKGGIGLFSYLGSPYTTSFTEADDGVKGFSVLYDSGELELIPVNSRKHVIVRAIVRVDQNELSGLEHNYLSGDILWAKLEGPRSVLSKIDKKSLGLQVFGTENYRLELLPLADVESKLEVIETLTPSVILESLICNLTEPEGYKNKLKTLYKDLMK